MTPTNLNRLKHGFYLCRWLPGDLAGLDAQELHAASLDGEIAILRVMLRRALLLSRDLEQLPALISMVDLSGRTTVRIAKLLRAQQELRLAAMQTGSGHARAETQGELRDGEEMYRGQVS